MFAVNVHFDDGYTDSFGRTDYDSYIDAVNAARRIMADNESRVVSILIVDTVSGEDRLFSVPSNAPADVCHVRF